MYVNIIDKDIYGKADFVDSIKVDTDNKELVKDIVEYANDEVYHNEISEYYGGGATIFYWLIEKQLKEMGIGFEWCNPDLEIWI